MRLFLGFSFILFSKNNSRNNKELLNNCHWSSLPTFPHKIRFHFFLISVIKKESVRYQFPAKLSESNSAGYLQVRFKVWPAWTTCCVPFILSSGTFNFDPALDPRKTKKKKIPLTTTNHPVPVHSHLRCYTGREENGVPPSPHILSSSEQNAAVLTQDSRNLPWELPRKNVQIKAMQVSVNDFAFKLFPECTMGKVQDLAATRLTKEVCLQALLAAFP